MNLALRARVSAETGSIDITDPTRGDGWLGLQFYVRARGYEYSAAPLRARKSRWRGTLTASPCATARNAFSTAASASSIVSRRRTSSSCSNWAIVILVACYVKITELQVCVEWKSYCNFIKRSPV